MEDYLNNPDIKYCVDCVYYDIKHLAHYPEPPASRIHCSRPRIPLSIITKKEVTWDYIYCEQDRKRMGDLVHCGWEARFYKAK